MIKLFEAISKVGSPRDKVDMLLSFSGQQELKTVLRLAVDPFITFGITDLTPGDRLSGEDHYYVLHELSHRVDTGKAAKDRLGKATHPDDYELVRRILRKDLRCGIGEGLVHQAYPDLIRKFDVMRAAKYTGVGPRGSFSVEPKLDGIRCLAFVEGDSVTLFSRNGLEITSCEHLKLPLTLLSGGVDCIFDGELTSGNFNNTSSAVRKKHVPCPQTVFNVFDHLDMVEWKNPLKSYHQRRNTLERLFGECQLTSVRLVPSYRVKSEDEIQKYYDRFLDQGLEGAIVKNNDGLYRLKRHRDWMKLKEINSVDLRVESLVQGEGKYHGTLGAIIVKFGNRRVSVGTGFSDAERNLWWKDPALIKGKVVEIIYHQVTPEGSLRHPRLKCIRWDKS